MTEKTSEARKGLTTKKIVLILAALIIICAAVVAAVFLLRDKPEVITPVMTEANLQEIKGEVRDKVAKGMFMTHMNTTWTFPDGQAASSNAVMGNSAANTYSFWFTVTVNDTGEEVYKSGLIPTGQQLGEIKLTKDLAKGTYPATINIQLVDENGEEIEDNMGFNITLEVEK